jgi:hypothetical protein
VRLEQPRRLGRVSFVVHFRRAVWQIAVERIETGGGLDESIDSNSSFAL